VDLIAAISAGSVGDRDGDRVGCGVVVRLHVSSAGRR
jgi:hypothetical protein